MSVSQDWAAPRTAHAFTGYLQDGVKTAGLVVRFLSHTPIPMSEDDSIESNQKRVTGTILGFPKLGFGSAPYVKKSSKPGRARAARARTSRRSKGSRCWKRTHATRAQGCVFTSTVL
jgi:hypothetical protein